MLVLTRRIGDSILIGDEVELVVDSIANGVTTFRIALPTDAPRPRGTLVSDAFGTAVIVIRRSVNEPFSVSSEITVYPCSLRGLQVRIGISAPMDVRILRKELVGPRVAA